jgi:glutamine synthetase
MEKISKIFGSKTFDFDIMRERLPSDAYKKIQAIIAKNETLNPELAEIVAHAIKEWAVEEGATHFTHWFQPDRAQTAEKHDAFLTTESFRNGLKPIERFSVDQLVQAEPDASSFPSGGVRSTFEARGYTAWDPTSPAFLKDHPGGKTLCIPSIYLSWTGEALDNKTPLLRSVSSLNKVVKEFFEVLKNPISGVYTTVGPEQEFFLIPKELFDKRPDLVLTGRTILGKPSPKGQKLEDHYFGPMPDRILKFYAELELEAYKLGIPLKTRHNEVAPSQFELAPIFEHSNVANDHNQLLMELMKKIALKNDLVCLLYEKPFAGVNGSGKHNNWSIMSFEGRNLLDPGKTREEHMEFMLIVAIIIRAVYKRSKLLRSIIAVPGNDFRLGANEAPPAILSVYIGDTLDKIFKNLESGGTIEKIDKSETIDEKYDLLGYTVGLDQLPNIKKDNTDRNRTSPFAWTGNKFEFRAIGSSQTLGWPNAVLNTIMAESFKLATKTLNEKIKKGTNKEVAILEVIKELYTESKSVIFNGNNYSEEWVVEAAKRGLPNIKTSYEALKELVKNEDVLTELKIVTSKEIHARYNVRLTNLIHQIHIEAETLLDMVKTGVIPAIVRYMGDVLKVKGVLYTETEVKVFSDNFSKLKEKIKTLEEELHSGNTDDLDKQGDHANVIIKSLMNEIRDLVDAFERTTPKDLWPYPSYADLLHTQ